ncbi:MAG: CPBP family intramembrane glutamic endopeptidase [Sphingomicrobium sp.]
MTVDQQQQPAVAKSTMRKVVEFPLVAMCIAIALLVGVIQATSAIFHFIPKKGIPAHTREIVVSLAVVALVVVAYKLVIRHLGEHPRDDLRSEHAGRDLGLGLVGGALIFSAVTAVAAMFGVYHIVGIGNANDLLYAAVTMGVVPAVMEETLFRGIMFRHLEDFGGTWFALALTSALFGVAHIFNPNATYFSSFAIAVEAGIMLGGAYMLTRSLWLPMGIHAAWNFTQGEIYDVPVSGIDQHGLVVAKMSGPEILSGGTFGLEASVIALVIATGFGLWMVVKAAQLGHVMRPWWVRRRLASQETVRVDVDRDADLGAPLDPA